MAKVSTFMLLIPRKLQLVCKDFKSSIHQLLEKPNSVSMHQCNLQTLPLQIFKVHNNTAPEITKDIFDTENQHYDFRRDVHLQCRNTNTALYDTEAIGTLGS